ncbi:hypothetical protein EBZ37_07865, partial [bacterium]|nr:hypothetical protein [bacterium]
MTLLLKLPDTTIGQAISDAAVCRGGVAHCFRRHPLDLQAELQVPQVLFQPCLDEIESWLRQVSEPKSLRPGCAAFFLEGTWERVNMIRRAFMTRVTTLACVRVIVYANGGRDGNEILAHRLGFLTLDLPPDITEATLPTGFWAELGPLTGPCTVKGRDLTIHAAPSIKLASSCLNSPLQVLPVGGMLHLRLLFAWGKPKDHARFCAVAVPSLWPRLSVSLDSRETLAEKGYSMDSAGLLCNDRAKHPWHCLSEVVQSFLPESWTPWPVNGGAEPRHFVLEVESLGQRTVEV